MTSPQQNLRLYHVSELRGISVFEPRPSPSHFDAINSDVVFAISGRLLHNYLLPRDCPRVTYYVNSGTNEADKAHFFSASKAEFIIYVPTEWYSRIIKTTLYCYEFAPDNFTLLDECAAYYISRRPERAIACRKVTDIMKELLARSVELRFTPQLIPIAKAVAASSLGFSNIRMRNAKA